MYVEYLINYSFSIEYTYENQKSKLRYYISKSILRFFASANQTCPELYKQRQKVKAIT